jgi:hypothetical protein
MRRGGTSQAEIKTVSHQLSALGYQLSAIVAGFYLVSS